MLNRLPRPLAMLFALLLVALSAWCLTATPPPIKTAKKGGYTDGRLYHDISSEVAKGRPYHLAAAELHRAHHYPLKPFITMRPPTEMVITAHIGWKGFQKICIVLLVASIFTWAIAYENRLNWLERIAMGAGVAAAGSSVSSDWLMALQEYPAGLCITVAMAGVIAWPRQWWYTVPVLGFGLFIRELALPMVLLCTTYAIWNKRWAESAAWGVLLAAWVGFMAWHASEVTAVVRPDDLVSVGWKAMQGFSGFLKAIIFTSPLQRLPLGWALLGAMLPMVGWLALSGRDGLFAITAVGGYALMIALFSRADTFYWGAIMLPWYFAGYALIPRALTQLYGAMRGEQLAAIPPAPMT
ncbi:hypothetical protein EOE18_05835 [Novosphingobium umbonatum]|uniref:DUF2029 domain-containing protein n=1 Tax=Novosphingobium umbonatum TaxID=1908524 RepID=A0A437N8T3_9SPHN|nr:hypothetical protein [Novosphingobium umbonatum]RVU06343.1 hypothetical protein EOE18_05835 [Novosphingobium umbonatum]